MQMRKVLYLLILAINWLDLFPQSATVTLRPQYIDLSSATAQSGVLMTLSSYSSNDAKYRLYNGANQYNCWDGTQYVTSTAYASGPSVPGTPTTSTTFWILFQRGANNATAASYRDRLGPAYSSNYQTVALSAATSITTPFTLSGNVTAGGGNNLDVKYAVLGWSTTNLITVTSTDLTTGSFSLVAPDGTTIDKIEIRKTNNTSITEKTGSWTSTGSVGNISLGSVSDPEPTNHVENLDVIMPNPGTMTVSYTENDGAQPPHGYLIIVNTLPITPPTDGVPQSNDNDLSSTGGVMNVSHGVVSVNFYNPLPGQTYNVTVYPYTNTGVSIDYKTGGDVPEIQFEAPAFTVAKYFDDNTQGNAIVKDEEGAQSWGFSSGFARMNGYSGASIPNTDWLILPQVNLSATSYLTFITRWHFGSLDADDYLKLMYSQDYDGTGAPSGFTWNEVSFNIGADNAWTNSGPIKIPVTGNTYIAFKYKSNDGARQWDVDEVLIASQVVFTGASSNDMSDPANWTGGVFPETFSVVKIENTLGVISGTLECQHMMIEPAGKLTVNGGGTLTVNGELYIKANGTGRGSFIPLGTATYSTGTVEIFFENMLQNYHFSIPVTTAKASVMGDLNVNFLYEYNTAGSSWSRITDGNADLVAGKGYVYKNTSGSYTAKFTGTIANGTINPPVLSNTGNNWWLVGNSYPSAIDLGCGDTPIGGWVMTDLRPTFYTRTNGAVVTYNWTGPGGGVNGGSRYFANNHAIWIKVTGASPAFTMANTVRVHNDVTFLKASEIMPVLRLSAVNGDFSDETLIRFHSNSLTGLDDYDSEKMLTEDTRYAEIYTISENSKLAINTYPETGDRLEIPVGFRCKADGQYTIKVSEMANFPADVTILLADNQLNKIVDLNITQSYAFFSTVTDNSSRFTLYFIKGLVPDDLSGDNGIAAGMGENNQNKIKIYGYNNQILVSTPETSGKIMVYDLTGKLVTDVTMNGNNYSINVENKGYYMVKVATSQQVITRKVFVK